MQNFVSRSFFVLLAVAVPSRAGCELSGNAKEISRLFSRYVPRGSNGRGAAGAVYRVDGNGDVVERVFERNANTAQAIASTQKIMTAYVAAKRTGLARTVRFNDLDMDFDLEGVRGLDPEGRKIQVGDVLATRDYLVTMLYQSSNGSAQAISRGGGAGDSRKFVSLMNSEARRLVGSGFDTYFQNAHGLTDDADKYRFGEKGKWQHSTANNLARIAAKIMADTGVRSAFASSGYVDAEEGVLRKSGSTQAAGRTYVVRFPLPDGCGAVAMAVFGEGTNAQSQRNRSFYIALRAAAYDELGVADPNPPTLASLGLD